MKNNRHMPILAAALIAATPLFTGCDDPPPDNENIVEVAAAPTIEVTKKASPKGGTVSVTNVIPSDVKLLLITNVVRAFYHEPGHFSVASLGKEGRLIFHDFARKDATIYADVPATNVMWALVTANPRKVSDTVKIHIHGVHELNGAGWQEIRDKARVEGMTLEVVE